MKRSRLKIIKCLGKYFLFSLPSAALVYTATLLILKNFDAVLQTDTFGSRDGSKQLKEQIIPWSNVGNKKNIDVHINYSNGENQHGLQVISNFSDVTFPAFVDSDDPNGPGANGSAVTIEEKDLSESDRQAYKRGWQQHNFNEYVSNMISVHRRLPPCSVELCKKAFQAFNDSLDPLSVIIIFHNEAWSTLLRSVHSVLSRTEPDLLREVILVDDFSTLAFLGAPLDKYFSQFPKVKIVRAKKKGGLIKARLLGFEASTAPVVVFLDSHIECYPDWADSLLLQIKLNPKAVVFPMIDSIRDKTFGVGCNNNPTHYGTFHFKNLNFDWIEVPSREPLIEYITDKTLRVLCNNNAMHYGRFNFKNLFFDWIEIPKREFDRRMDITMPFRSPVMPGGLFAISRRFFIELGTYDPELDYWGGENIELSFKTWMCGGTLLMDVCSHVGHIFRSSAPFKGAPNAVIKNSMRVAEVWMDDYKNYFFEATNYKNVDYGNVTDRKILRKGLKCHNFEWYLKNVFPELVIPHGIDYAGEIRSVAAPNCLDSGSSPEHTLIMYGCHGEGNNQLWYFNNNHQIYRENIFLCVKNGSTVLELNTCSSQGNWRYQEDKSLVHLPTNECLTAGVTDSKVSLTPCHPGNKWQQWHLQRRRSDLNFPK